MSVRFEVDIFSNAGAFAATLDPVDLNYQFVMKEPGSMWASFALSHPSLSEDLFRPKINDFALNMVVDESVTVQLMTGIVDSVNFRSESGLAEMTGKDYLLWLDQPYPFTAYTTFASISDLLATTDAEDFVKKWAAADGATMADVVGDLIDPLIAPGYGDDTPSLTLAQNGAAWSELIDWSVYFGDSTSVLDHIKAISDAYDPLGFDFWMEDTTLRLEGPRLINPLSVTPVYGFYDESTIVAIDWTNRGPMTTDIFGMGSGSGNVRGFHRKTDVDNVAQFRRWRSIVNFQSPATDLTSANIIENLVNAGEYLEPRKELKLTVNPNFIDGTESADGFENLLGEAVDVDITNGYHRINAEFYVTGQNFSSQDGSNFLLDFTLAQIY